MYKVFAQLFNSTIAEDYTVRHFFTDMLVLADENGCVSMTVGAIARRVGMPVEVVTQSIQKLSSPDTGNRYQENDGRWLVLISDSQPWGWRIVNFMEYLETEEREARRISNRSYKRAQRAKA